MVMPATSASLVKLFAAGHSKAVVTCDHADLCDALCLHNLEDASGGVAVFLGGLEHVTCDRVDNVFGGGAGKQNGLAFLTDILDCHCLAAGRRPDDCQDLIFLDELLGQRNGVFRFAA